MTAHMIGMIVRGQGALERITLVVDVSNKFVTSQAGSTTTTSATATTNQIGEILHWPDFDLLNNQLIRFCPISSVIGSPV